MVPRRIRIEDLPGTCTPEQLPRLRAFHDHIRVLATADAVMDDVEAFGASLTHAEFVCHVYSGPAFRRQPPPELSKALQDVRRRLMKLRAAIRRAKLRPKAVATPKPEPVLEKMLEEFEEPAEEEVVAPEPVVKKSQPRRRAAKVVRRKKARTVIEVPVEEAVAAVEPVAVLPPKLTPTPGLSALGPVDEPEPAEEEVPQTEEVPAARLAIRAAFGAT